MDCAGAGGLYWGWWTELVLVDCTGTGSIKSAKQTKPINFCSADH